MNNPADPATLGRETADEIRRNGDLLADALVAREFSRHSELRERYGPAGRAHSRADAGYHLSYLASALAAGSVELFLDYVAWAKVVLTRRGILESDIAFHLECMGEALRAHLPGEHGRHAEALVREGIARLPGMPVEIPTFIGPDQPHAPLAHQYIQTLLRGDRHGASRLILDAVEGGVSVRDIYLHVFQRAQQEIGRLWQSNQISVAREHFCTAVTQLIMSLLYPRIFSSDKTGGTLVATCVAGDLHEIGVRMVADFFEMAGWDTHYLGASTPATAVVDAVVEQHADVLGVSATMSYHLPGVETLIAAVRARPECADTHILVGGHPFNLDEGLWRKVGADGHARDAETAIALAGRLLDTRQRTDV